MLSRAPKSGGRRWTRKILVISASQAYVADSASRLADVFHDTHIFTQKRHLHPSHRRQLCRRVHGCLHSRLRLGLRSVSPKQRSTQPETNIWRSTTPSRPISILTETIILQQERQLYNSLMRSTKFNLQQARPPQQSQASLLKLQTHQIRAVLMVLFALH